MNRWIVSAAAAATIIGGTAQGGTDDVKFPANYASNFVLYTTVNKPSKKRGDTFRKFYVNKAALGALKAGGALPSGTVLVREDWFVKKDAANLTVRGTDGNFVPTKRKGIVVSEKRDGWGTSYPAGIRNGNWEYAAFRADGERNTKANIKRCFGCHLRMKRGDFVFTMKELRAAAR